MAGQTSSTVSRPNVPTWMADLTRGAGANWEKLMGPAFAGLENFLGMSGEGGGAGGPITGLGPQEKQAQSMIDQLTSGPIGSSPATAAGMRAYTDIAMPRIEQAQSLAGGGRGGSLEQALTMGQEGAYMPLIEQEIQNRELGIGQEAALGQTAYGRLTGLGLGPASEFGPSMIGSSSRVSSGGPFGK